jgi:hypothetical protein
MRKFFTLAALALSLAMPTMAQAGFLSFLHQNDPYGFQKPLIGPRAAPWFTYWPYPAYFNTPAPTGVAFPPGVMTPGNFMPHGYDGAVGGGGFVPYPTNGFGQ